jgi:hypothetical protein
MSNVQEIESAIGRLSAQDMRQIYEWLENLLEDQMEISEVFQQRIERSEREMAEGKRPRVRHAKTP